MAETKAVTVAAESGKGTPVVLINVTQAQPREEHKPDTSKRYGDEDVEEEQMGSSVIQMQERAPRIISQDDEGERGRFVDLGLGRGVDASDPNPWLNKTSFQVRNVLRENIIGTDEGSALHTYQKEVISAFTLQAQLKASIPVPQAPIAIGVDSEQSKSVASTKRVVGCKVLVRTISFREGFEDIPYTEQLSYSHQNEANEEKNSKKEELLTFEERLGRWIARRMAANNPLCERFKSAGLDGEKDGIKLGGRLLAQVSFDGGQQQLEQIELGWRMLEYTAKTALCGLQRASPKEPADITKLNKDLEVEVESAVKKFVETFHITHYVSALSLGAVEYSVFTEEQYSSRFHAKTSLGLDAAGASVSSTAVYKRTTRKSESRRIGRFEGKGEKRTVKAGSSGEAVIGIQVQPITNLIVHYPQIQRIIRRVLLSYVKKRQTLSHGPFYITCDGDKKFLEVLKSDRDGYKVYATTTPSKASHFYIIPTEDDEHHFEFYIAYRGGFGPAKKTTVTVEVKEQLQSPVKGNSKEDSEQNDGQEVEELQYYLSAPVPATHKTRTGPLEMKLNVVSEHARFTLRNRVYKRHRFLSRNRKNVDTAPWVAHRDTFYIRCARRGLGRKAFLAVKKESGAGTGAASDFGAGTGADTGVGNGTESRPKYKTLLTPDIHHHQEHDECFMLFRLLPSSYKLGDTSTTESGRDGGELEEEIPNEQNASTTEGGRDGGESEEEIPNEQNGEHHP